MMHQSQSLHIPSPDDAGRQLAQLRHVLELVAQLAGRPAADHDGAALDAGARLTGAYDRAMPIVQRRFDAHAAETATWAAAGVHALLGLRDGAASPKAAAARLADELEAALAKFALILDA